MGVIRLNQRMTFNFYLYIHLAKHVFSYCYHSFSSMFDSVQIKNFLRFGDAHHSDCDYDDDGDDFFLILY